MDNGALATAAKALDDAGIEYTLGPANGWPMAIAIAQPGGTWAITGGDPERDQYATLWYPGTEWQDGGTEGELDSKPFPKLEELAAKITGPYED